MPDDDGAFGDDSPISIIQDRHGGAYSGGVWLAISAADRVEKGAYRVVRCLEGGPGAGDAEAREFWSDPPAWIAVGNTPDEAVAALRARSSEQDERVLAELDRAIAEGTADLDAGRVHSGQDVKAFLQSRFGRDLDAAE